MIDSNYKFTHDGSPEYARKALQLSLENLGVDYIDLYILRSKDPKVPIEESVKAMAVSTSVIYISGTAQLTSRCIKRWVLDCMLSQHKLINAFSTISIPF